MNLLSLNYFELFGLEPSFALDQSQLQHAMRNLQKEYHPDNFARQSQELLNQALQISSYINQGYTTLSQAQSRAIYLLSIYGIQVDLVHDTKFTPEFLMAQIELRERIAAAEAEAESLADFVELEQIESELKANVKQLEQQLSDSFRNAEYSAIVEQIKHLAFYNKLEQLVSNILAQM